VEFHEIFLLHVQIESCCESLVFGTYTKQLLNFLIDGGHKHDYYVTKIHNLLCRSVLDSCG
jgi:hypothetical protein